MTLAPLLEASLAIQIHTLSAVLAFLLGGLVLFREKGGFIHRLGGRLWAVLMLVVCVTSMFIHSIQLVGLWSPIHILSIVTVVFLYRGIAAARARRIVEHRATMQGLYLGALVIAGLFTFLPGRIMYEVFFEGPRPWLGVLVSVVIVGFLLMLLRTMLLEAGRARHVAAAR